MKDSQIISRMKSNEVMANREPSSLCNKRPRTLMQGIGNEKPKSLAKTTPVNQRSQMKTSLLTTIQTLLTTMLPLVTRTTTPARRMTKDRSSKTLESNNRPPDLL
jgi:hypothetical protein